jgi:hypothetical protein
LYERLRPLRDAVDRETPSAKPSPSGAIDVLVNVAWKLHGVEESGT